MTYRKKLIDVALPLEAINNESAARKRKAPSGYPTGIHKWWAQRPIAACRAVLFASIIDDPSSQPDKFPTEAQQHAERERLFRIIEELVKWENSDEDSPALRAARDEINRATQGRPPAVLDPFSGGGSIPLESLRLGLETHAGDLNPVAVLITKALVELPSRFAGRPPVNPRARENLSLTGGSMRSQGLIEDVQYYGSWMREEAHARIGHLYPDVQVSEGAVAKTSAVAWLWSRTVQCPNPACGAEMPLVRSFWLSTKARGRAWVQPIVDPETKRVRFEVRTGLGDPPEGTVSRRGASCFVCSSPVDLDYVRSAAMRQGMGQRLMAVVADGRASRLYLSPSDSQEVVAKNAQPAWKPDALLPDNKRDIRPQLYGLPTYGDLFTERQLSVLSTLSDLVVAAHARVEEDALASRMSADPTDLSGARSYADAVATYLAFAVSRMADYGCSLASWRSKDSAMRSGLAKQALPMTWDFAEGNPFGSSSAGFSECLNVVAKCIAFAPSSGRASVSQRDAAAGFDGGVKPLICTDPPYYDNIAYAELADFFYVWLRRSLAGVYPDLFSTLLTPKAQELIATPHRFGGDQVAADRFFEDGLARVFARFRQEANPDFPITLFYAFKQAESQGNGNGGTVTVSTGWETMLEGLVRSGLSISGTWPMRTEGDNRQIGVGANALASSIVLVCRPRSASASLVTRREFVAALRAELPAALRALQEGNVAPVDLAQAAIGPGMAVFSRYAKVIDADGNALPVRDALGLINQALDELVTEQEGEMDAESRWAIAWFEEFGFGAGPFGVAETLSKAKNTSVGGLVENGFAEAPAGRVRLLRPDELDRGWNPIDARRPTVWEIAHHAIYALESGGEEAAAELLRGVGGLGETARDLAYRLYLVCDRNKWNKEAIGYNSLVVSWPELMRRASGDRPMRPTQQTLEA